MKVVLVDDHAAMRDGLEVLLERKGVRVLGTAETAAGAEEIIRELKPEVAVVDLNLPDESGLSLIRRLRRDHAQLRLLVYTGAEDAGTLGDALESGAMGFVLKSGGIGTLVEALRLVARGEHYIDPAIRALLDAEQAGESSILSPREREVFDLLAKGLTGEQIAEELVLSPETVRTHIRNAMGKLQARTRTEAVVQALKLREIAD